MLIAFALALGFVLGIAAYSLKIKLEIRRKERLKKLQAELWRKKRIARLVEKRRRLRNRPPC